MSISERIEGTIESWSGKWAGRLAGWFMDWLSAGIHKLLELLEPGLKEMAGPWVKQMQDNPEVPQDLKDQLRHAMGAGNILETIFIEITIILGAFGVLLGGSQPLGRILSYYQDREKRSFRLDPISVITAWRRDPDKYAPYFDDLLDQGWSPERIEALKFFTLYYPSPQDLVRFQAREVLEAEMIERYGLDDEFGNIDLEPFRKAGMSDEIALYYWRAHWEHASWNQVVEMLHRGQLTEAEVSDWFRLVEIPPFWRDKLIATSWNVPTRVDVRRFYDLRTIDETRLREIYTAMGYHGKDLDDYVLWTKIYVELPDLIARWKNGWITLDDARDQLIALGMTAANAEELIQTKVKLEEPDDVKDSKNLTKTEIYKAVKQAKISRDQAVDLLMDLEYSRDAAELLLDINVPVDETDEVVEERKLSKSDIKAALALGEISEAEARSKLAELRYSAANIDLLIRIFQASIKPPETAKLKEASKADILEGVKKGVISSDEGYLMLIDMGFSPDAASFILTVRAEESPFSPTNYNEFKDLTSKYKKAVGMQTTPVPEEIRTAADDLVKIQLEVEALERSEKTERRMLTAEEPVPDAASAKLKDIQVALNRARAELQRRQLEYNALVAKWKFGRG